jgi:hypothetical protein
MMDFQFRPKHELKLTIYIPDIITDISNGFSFTGIQTGKKWNKHGKLALSNKPRMAREKRAHPKEVRQAAGTSNVIRDGTNTLRPKRTLPPYMAVNREAGIWPSAYPQ